VSARPAPPRLALRPAEAAEACGYSRDHFDEHVGPHLRWVRTGRIKVVPVEELTRWLRENAERALEEG
jgi:hypothetical protein